MEAVRTVHIGKAGWPEHRCIAGSRPAEAVRGRVSVVIGLHFHDDSPDAAKQQPGANEVRGYFVHTACKKITVDKNAWHRRLLCRNTRGNISATLSQNDAAPLFSHRKIGYESLRKCDTEHDGREDHPQVEAPEPARHRRAPACPPSLIL